MLRNLFLVVILVAVLMLVSGGTCVAEGYAPSATANMTLAAKGYPRLAFDPTGTRLAVALSKTADKGRIDFLNVPDLAVIREVHTETEPSSLAFSQQGDYFALSLSHAKDSEGLRFVVLNTVDWNAIYAERGLRQDVLSLAFDPVGDLLYTGGSDPNEIYRFGVGTWQREKIPSLAQAPAACQCLTVSPDGRFAAMGSPDKRLLVWPLDDSSSALVLGTQQFTGAVTAVSFNPRSDLLAAGDDKGTVMSFYRTHDGLWAWKTLFNLPGGAVTGVGFLNDGSLVTSSTEGKISRWNPADTTRPVETFEAGAGNSEALAIDSNGRWMAVGGTRISLYPLGSSVPLPATELPAAPWTVVNQGSTDISKPAQDVPAVSAAATGSGNSDQPSPPTPRKEDVANFLIWTALGRDGDDGQDWIQAWAANLDEGRFAPLQLVLPFESLTRPVMKSNLSNLDKILTAGDFNVFYTSAVLSPTKEAGDFPLGVGPNPVENQIQLSEWLKGLQASAAVAPTIWFLDLHTDPKMAPEKAVSLFDKLTRRVGLNDDNSKRTPIGVGILALSKQGSYPELVGNLPDALSGKADDNKDGSIVDRELVLYLADRCRTATRIQPIGDAQNTIPVLPPFRLQ